LRSELHASSHEKIQGIKSTFQAARSIFVRDYFINGLIRWAWLFYFECIKGIGAGAAKKLIEGHLYTQSVSKVGPGLRESSRG